MSRHPLPWHMPTQPRWVQLRPGLDYRDGDPQRFELRLGHLSGTIATLTRAELASLRDAADAALAAPFLVLVLGGDIAEPWMRAEVAEHLGKRAAGYPRMEVAYAGRPGSVDEMVAEWAEEYQVRQHVGPVDVLAGGSAALLFCTGDGDRNLALVSALHEAGVPFWWCRRPAEAGAA